MLPSHEPSHTSHVTSQFPSNIGLEEGPQV